jgi:DNA-binding HxlR family transcriptional regulator
MSENLNDLEVWILDFLDAHEWATPNLLRAHYNDQERSEEGHVSRQWVSSRVKALENDGHIEKVHPESDEYQLVDDPRD